MRAAITLILLAACSGAAVDAPPTDAAGTLVGAPIGGLAGVRWLTPDGAPPAGQPATLLRWWTVDCPFCRDSLPDLSALAQEFAPRGLVFAAVFHAKAAPAPSDDELRRYLADLGVRAVVARDDRWEALEPLRRRGRLDAATSISVLVDGAGIVRWVHSGPRLHGDRLPGDRLHSDRDGEFAQAAADLQSLRSALTALLGGR
jgi:thiol-disulfide isomerase/thioredoxin